MRYRKLTADGDYLLGHREKDFIKDIESIGQAIKTRLLFLYGEWWEDTQKGFPLFQSILGKRGTAANLHTAELLILDVIKNTPGVTGVTDITVRFDSGKRTFSYRAKVQTVYSQTIIMEGVI